MPSAQLALSPLESEAEQLTYTLLRFSRFFTVSLSLAKPYLTPTCLLRRSYTCSYSVCFASSPSNRFGRCSPTPLGGAFAFAVPPWIACTEEAAEPALSTVPPSLLSPLAGDPLSGVAISPSFRWGLPPPPGLETLESEGEDPDMLVAVRGSLSLVFKVFVEKGGCFCKGSNRFPFLLPSLMYRSVIITVHALPDPPRPSIFDTTPSHPMHLRLGVPLPSLDAEHPSPPLRRSPPARAHILSSFSELRLPLDSVIWGGGP